MTLQTQLVMGEKFQNLWINHNYGNVNSNHYSLDPINAMTSGIEAHDVIGYDSQQNVLVVMLFYVFDILHTGFEKKSKSRHDSTDNDNDYGTTRITHITRKTALRIQFLFSQERKDRVIMQYEACLPV